jgi:uncharacterized membrane protein
MTRVVAFVPDLMDRSRLGSRPIEVVADLERLATSAPGAALVVVDLARPGALEAAASLVGSGTRVVGFAPHVDDDLRRSAAASGVEVVTRSRFFGRLDEVLGSSGPD